MSKLWKTVCKGFRHYVGSFVNVESTHATGYGSISSLSEHDFGQSQNACKVVPSNVTASIKEDQGKYSGFNKYEGSYFKWNETLTKSVFLEICGLSSAIAFGWQFSQPNQKRKEAFVDNSSSLVKVLAKLALTSVHNGARLNINVPSANANISTPAGLVSTNTSQISNANVSAALELTVPEEINKTFMELVETLDSVEATNLLGLAEWQNSVGVQLISSAKKNEISEYDHLITNPKSDRTSTYQKEALLCFIESMKLGSAKGAYNLGLCYEQGLGTSIDLEKASVCYEAAANKNHSAAQYNLGLLHYRRYISNNKSKESDLFKALSLLRQAAHQGLEQARSAISTINDEVAARGHLSTTSMLGYDKEKNSSLFICGSPFRKAFSEPHDFGYNSNDSSVRRTSFRLEKTVVKSSVSFYVGD